MIGFFHQGLNQQTFTSGQLCYLKFYRFHSWPWNPDTPKTPTTAVIFYRSAYAKTIPQNYPLGFFRQDLNQHYFSWTRLSD